MLKFTQPESGKKEIDSNPGNLAPVPMNLASTIWPLKSKLLQYQFQVSGLYKSQDFYD